jgi:hypothetical protein
MGFQETQHTQMDMYSRSVIVALSAQPPGVNELFVCLFVYTVGFEDSQLILAQSQPRPQMSSTAHSQLTLKVD